MLVSLGGGNCMYFICYKVGLGCWSPLARATRVCYQGGFSVLVFRGQGDCMYVIKVGLVCWSPWARATHVCYQGGISVLVSPGQGDSCMLFSMLISLARATVCIYQLQDGFRVLVSPGQGDCMYSSATRWV